jgi:hypothetical protein
MSTKPVLRVSWEKGVGGVSDTPGGWICLSLAGCVTHKHLWKLMHDSGKIVKDISHFSHGEIVLVTSDDEVHQETPPNYQDVLFSRCFKMTCKMFYYSKRCFKF